MFTAKKSKVFGCLFGWVLFLASLSFSEELTRLELPERPEVPDSTAADSSSDWFGGTRDSTLADTVEYRACNTM